MKECPDLLCDDTGSREVTTPKIAFVGRQLSLPEAGILDLLFVTSDGLPIAVEVKLARNAQARREVIAQAIDYVSALTALTVDELDELVDGRLEQALYGLTVNSDTPFDTIWRSVGRNLRAGKARLIIALDDSTPPLERIFHFLARSSDLDVQLLTIQRYPSTIAQIVVSRTRVSPVFENKADDERPNPRRSGPARDDNEIITVLVTGNPKRAGSAAYERFALYRTGMTVGQFLATGGLRVDITWDVNHGFIKLDPGKESDAADLAAASSA